MKLVLIFFAVIFAFKADAKCSQNSCDTNISRLYLTSLADGRVFVEPSDVASEIINCEMAEGKFFTLYKSHPLFREVYSTLLTAKISNRSVRLRIVENTSGCKLAYIWLM